MTQKDNGPGPGQNYGETGVFTFGRKVVFGLCLAFHPLLDVHYYQRNSHPPFLPQTQSSQSSVDRGRGLLDLPRPFREKVLQTNAFPRIGFGPSLIRSLAGFVQSRRGAEDR